MTLRMITIIRQRMFQRGLFSINQAVRGVGPAVRTNSGRSAHETVRTADPTNYNTAIIGGGIVGIAAAKALLERRGKSLVVLENKTLREDEPHCRGGAALLVPDLAPTDFVRGKAGIRAQAVDASGRLLDDFRVQRAERMIHVLNAPSPAATAALSIGHDLAAMAQAS